MKVLAAVLFTTLLSVGVVTTAEIGFNPCNPELQKC